MFRGEFRLAIPYRLVTSATAASGQLSIIFAGGKAIFDLGEATATKWAEKISDQR